MKDNSIKSKVQDIRIVTREFTDEETGEVIPYKRVVVDVMVDGEPEEVELKAKSSDGYTILRLAEDAE